MEDLYAVIMSIILALAGILGSGIFYRLGVEKGKEQSEQLITQFRKDLVDAINSNRRVDEVTSGEIAIRDDGKIGSNLVVSSDAENKSVDKVNATSSKNESNDTAKYSKEH
jgi:hypothetical protein